MSLGSRIRQIIMCDGTKIDVSDYNNFWVHDGSGGGSCHLIASSFLNNVMENRFGNPSRYVVLSRRSESFGYEDPAGLQIKADDIASITTNDSSLYGTPGGA